MTITIEQLPGEPILIATLADPFDVTRDMPTMFIQTAKLRGAQQTAPVYIIDLTNVTHNFSEMMLSLGEAASRTKQMQREGMPVPKGFIMVGSGDLVELAAQALGQEHYGRLNAAMVTTRDEAISEARKILMA